MGNILPFERPVVPMLSERAQRTAKVFEEKGFSLDDVNVPHLMLSLRECGLEIPWDAETKFLEDIEEIRRHRLQQKVHRPHHLT